MRLLDLYCGAGGAAMGYHRAGFTEIVGVDIESQPQYPFAFVQADALTYPLDGFDAIHASPVCQGYSRAARQHRQRGVVYADDLAAIRERLQGTSVPWVIENVPLSPIKASLLLCGSMFGLRVQRHRFFESNIDLGFAPSACVHPRNFFFNMYGCGPVNRRGTERQYIDEMGVSWATTRKGREAIPPVFTEFVGKRLLRAIELSRGVRP